MLFKYLTLVSGLALVASAAVPAQHQGNTKEHGSPQDQGTNGLVEIQRHAAKHSDGHLIYYSLPGGHDEHGGDKDQHGSSEDHEKGGQLAKRKAPSCSTTGQLKCGSSNTARNAICDSLVTELGNDPTINVGSSPRQVCYQGSAAQSNEYCCASWSKVIPNLTKGDLSGVVNQVLQSCTSNGISGKVNNVKVKNTCVNVCLSNRGTHCS